MQNYWNGKRSFLSELLNDSKWSPHLFMAYGITAAFMIKYKNDLRKKFLNDLLFQR